MNIALEEAPSAQERRLRLALFLAWAMLVMFLASQHVFWRDEVRALTLALNGDSVAGMLRGVKGEGHPALWYLLLRGAHVLMPVREVLPLVAGLVAAGAMALLLFRSPFRLSLLVLISFGAVALFEYAVMARNYGISMLILFALADRYPGHRDRGVLLGVLLALLCNTNVHSAFLAAGFLLFWFVELMSEEGLKWSGKYRIFAINAAIAALGALACFLLIFPTVHDAAALPHPEGITAWTVLEALVTPASSFRDLAPPFVYGNGVGAFVLGLVLVGSIVGLARSPGAFLSALVVLPLFMLLFQLVYTGGYRHQALYLVYLITMYWLVANGRGGRWPEGWRFPRAAMQAVPLGAASFMMLLALQVLWTGGFLGREARDIPASRARDLGDVLKREKLLDATVIADFDILLEPLPYYAPNSLYLLREQRFGKVVSFTTKARLNLSLQNLLDDARMLRTRSGKPVVILLKTPPDPEAPPLRISEGRLWSLDTYPEQVGEFLGATRRLASFGPAWSGENYDVYVLGVSTR